jgi:hypothetical protein
VYPIECVICHGRFQAKRETARYCSDRCRKRRQRAGLSADELAALPARREGAPLVTLAPKPGSGEEGRFATETRLELEAAGRLDSFYSRAALFLARVADAAESDTGAGYASLMKQYIATMQQALDGAVAAETPLEKIRRERDLMAG